MDDFKLRFCKVCLTTISGESHEAIEAVTEEILDLLKLNLDADGKYIMCNICSTKVYAALKFKSTCRHADNAITSYVDDTTSLPISLREIYMKEKGGVHLLDGIKICRLCMQPIECLTEFISINEEQVDMIHTIIPEIEISIIKEPVMCKLCLDSLAMHCDFLKRFLDTEQNIRDISNEQIADAPSPVPSLDIPVKIEDVDIKFADECKYLDINYEENNLESEHCDQEIPSKSTFFKNHKTRNYKCSFCNYETNKLSSLNKHEVIGHKKHKKLYMYKCDNCNYKTKFESNLETHMLVHKDPSEVQMYKCENCEFQTKFQTVFKRHILIHKDLSEVEMYECEDCTFQTKYLATIKRHMLVHKGPSEAQMYKCEKCSFETKHRNNLNRHALIHKCPSEVKMYKCEDCALETKYQTAIKKHMLIHKSPSEVQMYKCKHCKFQSKFRTVFKRHVLVHKDPSQVQMYECGNCTFQTKYRAVIKRHMLIHQGPSEVQMYKCEKCNFETKHKGNINRHMLIHKYPSEVKCKSVKIVSLEPSSRQYLKGIQGGPITPTWWQI